ncbi:MAG TPA: choice-of-anchor D domain-containing protein [Burkholderiaceae bacterium]|nr:choice-of-anchor D domain-containing protein [Burkholderiaceae bacterium]
MRVRNVWAIAAAAVLALTSCGGSDTPLDSSTSAQAPSNIATALRAQTKPDLKVLSIIPVGESVVVPGYTDKVFRIMVLNGPSELTGYMATVIGAGAGTTIVDGSVLLGTLRPRGTTSPADTITLRQNQALPFIPARIVWEITAPINGIPVPPLPDPVANQATIAGVDANQNGIRDDIDIYLATSFGTDVAQYETAVQHARSLQVALVSPSVENSAQHLASFLCVQPALLPRLSGTTLATLDSPLRRGTYRDVFAGSLLSREGCELAPLASASLRTASPGRATKLSSSIAPRQYVIYINGIQNTQEEALNTAVAINDVLKASRNHTDSTNRSFLVDSVWNPVGFYGEKDGNLWAEDNAELFVEKTAEEWFREKFLKILTPHNQRPEQSDVIRQSAAISVRLWLQNMLQGRTSLESDPVQITAGSMAKTQEAVYQLMDKIRKRPTVVIAHSQGNLLANLAHAALAAEDGIDVYKMLRVVNVANTSLFSVSRLNLTHDKDRALAGLGALPTVHKDPKWGRNTPLCGSESAWGYCLFYMAPATFSADDEPFLDTRHNMVDTYLSDRIIGVIDSQGVSFTPGANSFRDRFEDLVYAGAASLEAANTSPSEPNIEIAPPSYDFGSQQLGTPSALKVFGITNTGSAQLTISSITPTGANAGDFSIANETCTTAPLAPAGGCSVSVVFTPSALGARSAVLSIADNAAGTPHSAALAGTGLAGPPPPPTVRELARGLEVLGFAVDDGYVYYFKYGRTSNAELHRVTVDGAADEILWTGSGICSDDAPVVTPTRVAFKGWYNSLCTLVFVSKGGPTPWPLTPVQPLDYYSFLSGSQGENLYLTEASYGVRRINLDNLADVELFGPTGISGQSKVDFPHIYYMPSPTSGQLRRVNTITKLDELVGVAPSPFGWFAIDSDNVYFGGRTAYPPIGVPGITRVSKSNFSDTSILAPAYLANTIAATGGTLYFYEGLDNNVRSVPVTGGAVSDVLFTGEGDPRWALTDGTAVFWNESCCFSSWHRILRMTR